MSAEGEVRHTPVRLETSCVVVITDYITIYVDTPKLLYDSLTSKKVAENVRVVFRESVLN